MHGCRTAFRVARLLLLGSLCLSSGLTGCQNTQAAKRITSKAPEEKPADSMVLRAGHVEEATPDTTPVPAELTEAMDAYRKDEFTRAERLFRRVAEDKKTDPLVAEKARFYQAECLRRDNYLPSAADAYNRMLLDFPAGVYREQAVQRMYQIAAFWLKDTQKQMELEQERRDGKRWFVPTNFVHWDRSKPFLDVEGRAMQVLEQVHYNDPTGPCSDKALYLLGYVNFYNGNFKEADLFFSQLVEVHENSPLRPKAAEMAIVAKNNSTGGPEYDGRASSEALKLVHQARASIPELAGRAKFLDDQAVAIRQQQADKDYAIADFYRRTGHPGSAYFYYELVRRRYPDTEHARKAVQQMQALHSELEESRNGGDFWNSTRRGFNKYVLGTPDAELHPGQELPPPPGPVPVLSPEQRLPELATPALPKIQPVSK